MNRELNIDNISPQRSLIDEPDLKPYNNMYIERQTRGREGFINKDLSLS